jgi:hypothetical protein
MAADDDSCVKTIIGESRQCFEDAFRCLEATNDTPLNNALSHAFRMLDEYRLKENVDNFGLGRLPW